jgi:CBS domain containing-hemolysin-like protein
MAASAWGSLSGANVLIWIGIALCITQSAIFSGLNLAIFSVSKLRLEVEVAGGNRDAFVLLDLRKDSNLTLANGAMLRSTCFLRYCRTPSLPA